jgi:predicted amidophosphoribosyltransferase
MPFLSNLKFGSYLNYCSNKNATSNNAKMSRNIVWLIKNNKENIIQRALGHLKENINSSILKDFFDEDSVLVPIPRSKPQFSASTIYPSQIICQELVNLSLGKTVKEAVKRVEPIIPTHFRNKGERPKIKEHIETSEIHEELTIFESKIILVDDVITKGTTFLAYASMLKERYPLIEIKAFALTRTRGFGDIEQLIEPFIGEIYEKNGEGNRRD